MLRPDGVYQSAVVSLSALPSVSGKRLCALPFPYDRRPDDHCAIVILQRAGDDLRRARAAAVHEHDERELRPRLGQPIDEVAIAVLRAAAHAHDLLSRIEKEIRDADALVEQTARIAAQIEHQRPHAARAQRIDGARGAPIAEFSLKIGERDVADAVPEHERMLHGVHVDLALA